MNWTAVWLFCAIAFAMYYLNAWRPAVTEEQADLESSYRMFIPIVVALAATFLALGKGWLG